MYLHWVKRDLFFPARSTWKYIVVHLNILRLLGGYFGILLLSIVALRSITGQNLLCFHKIEKFQYIHIHMSARRCQNKISALLIVKFQPFFLKMYSLLEMLKLYPACIRERRVLFLHSTSIYASTS